MSYQLVGGRLKNYLHFWKKLTSDTIILSNVAGLKIDFVKFPLQNSILNQIHCSLTEKSLIDFEI